MKRKIDLPTLTFGVLLLCLIALVAFMGILPSSDSGGVALGPIDANARSCRYCDGWYYCGKPTLCCHKWHNACGGRGSSSTATSTPALTRTPTAAPPVSPTPVPTSTPTKTLVPTEAFTLTPTPTFTGPPPAEAPYVQIFLSGSHADLLSQWWVTPIQATVDVSYRYAPFEGSDITSFQYSVDGEAWQNGTLDASGVFTVVVSAQGYHTFAARATNSAGTGAASSTFQIDSLPPVTTFVSPGTNAVVRGPENISGQTWDATSGVGGTQISLDHGSTWTDLASSASWSYAFDSARLPNGPFTILGRGVDNAGNTSIPASLRLILDNHPPLISVPALWDSSVSAALTVEPNIIPLKDVEITLRGGGQTESLFDGLPAPSSIHWDRALGSLIAAPGDYAVIVKACDVYNLCAHTTSTIVVQGYPILPTPTLTLTPAPAPAVRAKKNVSAPVEKPAPTPAPAVRPLRMIIASPATAPAGTDAGPLTAWPAVLVSLLILQFAALLLFDPRPKVYRSLSKTIFRSIRAGKKPTPQE